MEFLNDAHIKQLKSDLFETYKKEINAKIKDLEQTFKNDNYIILQPKNYINQNLADIEMIEKKNFDDDTTRNICTELAIKEFIRKVHHDTKKDQPKYALYEINDRNKTFTVIIVAHNLAKELPLPSELYQAIRYGRTKNSDGTYKRNIKINVEDSKNEIKKIFLGILLHTRLNIKQPTANALTFAFNPSHKPTIKSDYLSLHLNYYNSVELLDEDNQIIDPDYYVPLDLVHICKDRSSVE